MLNGMETTGRLLSFFGVERVAVVKRNKAAFSSRTFHGKRTLQGFVVFFKIFSFNRKYQSLEFYSSDDTWP